MRFDRYYRSRNRELLFIVVIDPAGKQVTVRRYAANEPQWTTVATFGWPDLDPTEPDTDNQDQLWKAQHASQTRTLAQAAYVANALAHNQHADVTKLQATAIDKEQAIRRRAEAIQDRMLQRDR